MTKKTRYFVLGAVAVLLVGLGGGLIAYLAYTRADGVAGMPPEMRYVPVDAALVAYADVRAVMDSDVRRALMAEHRSRIAQGPADDERLRRRRRRESRSTASSPMSSPHAAADPQTQAKPEMPRALVLVQGSFEPARIEAFVREHAGTIEEYKGQKILVRTDEGHDAGGRPDRI